MIELGFGQHQSAHERAQSGRKSEQRADRCGAQSQHDRAQQKQFGRTQFGDVRHQFRHDELAQKQIRADEQRRFGQQKRDGQRVGIALHDARQQQNQHDNCKVLHDEHRQQKSPVCRIDFTASEQRFQNHHRAGHRDHAAEKQALLPRPAEYSTEAKTQRDNQRELQ